MRRFATWLLVTGATAALSLWWLYEGDLGEAVHPVLPWDAEALATKAGFPATERPPTLEPTDGEAAQPE